MDRRKLAAALRVSADELSELLDTVSEVPGRADGYLMRSSVPLDFSKSTDSVLFAEGFSAHDLASRRQILERLSILSSAALLRPIRQWVVASLPVLPDDPTTLADLNDLQAAVKLFRRWDASGVGGLKRKAVVGQLNAVAENVHDASVSATRTQLLSVMAQLAGWMAYDQGLPGVAQRYYVLALHACREAGPSAVALGVKVIGDMTQLSTALGNYDDSLKLAQSGLYALPRAESRLVRSELLGLESRAFAQLSPREATHAARSAEACVDVWHEAADDGPAPDWLHYMNQAEVDSLAANTFTHLALQTNDQARWQAYAGRAEHHTMQARQARANGYDRSRILDEIRLAKVRLSQREPVESVEVATTALRLAEPVRSSLVYDRLRDYLRLAAPIREVTSLVEFAAVDGELAMRRFDELTALYTEVYAEPPYEWWREHAELFAERFHVQRRQNGFTLIEARDDGELVGMGFGVTVRPNTPWWQNLTTPVAEDVTHEYPNRTFALIELLVRAPWRRQHVAEVTHDLLIADRREERATLTVLPAAEAAQAAYRKWGWQSFTSW